MMCSYFTLVRDVGFLCLITVTEGTIKVCKVISICNVVIFWVITCQISSEFKSCRKQLYFITVLTNQPSLSSQINHHSLHKTFPNWQLMSFKNNESSKLTTHLHIQSK